MFPDYNEDFQSHLINAVNNGDDIVFISYACLNETEDKIKYALALILDKTGMMELYTPLIACIKELIANATKANAKKLLIDEGIIRDPLDHVDVVRKIRSILNERALLEYAVKCKEKRLSTRIYFKLSEDRLTIDVINNIPLPDDELKRIHGRMESSAKYDNLAEFYLDNPDPRAEGMGLGLSMVMVLLKNIFVQHSTFRITTDRVGKTRARIEIPVN